MGVEYVDAFLSEHFVDWQLLEVARLALFSRVFFELSCEAHGQFSTYLAERGVEVDRYLDNTASGTLLDTEVRESVSSFLAIAGADLKELQQQVVSGALEAVFFGLRLRRFLAQKEITVYGSHAFSNGMMEVWDSVLGMGSVLGPSSFRGTRLVLDVTRLGTKLRAALDLNLLERQALKSEVLDMLKRTKFEQGRIKSLVNAFFILLDYRSLDHLARVSDQSDWYEPNLGRSVKSDAANFRSYLIAFVDWLEHLILYWRLVAVLLEEKSEFIKATDPLKGQALFFWSQLGRYDPQDDLRALWLSLHACYHRVRASVTGNY